MATCTTFVRAIKKRVEEGKNLDTIAEELCDVKLPRRKVIRVIKDFLGDDYLKVHAETLGYDTEMAELAHKRTLHQKDVATTECDPIPPRQASPTTPEEGLYVPLQNIGATTEGVSVSQDDELQVQVRRLVIKHGAQAVIAAVQLLSSDKPTSTENTPKPIAIDAI